MAPELRAGGTADIACGGTTSSATAGQQVACPAVPQKCQRRASGGSGESRSHAAAHLPALITRLSATARWLLAPPAPLDALAARLPPKALLLLGRGHPLRRAAVALTHARAFDALVLAAIAANCICLALSSAAPGFHVSRMGRALLAADQAFLAVFGAEMLLKWIAQGIVLAPGTYFRNGAGV